MESETCRRLYQSLRRIHRRMERIHRPTVRRNYARCRPFIPQPQTFSVSGSIGLGKTRVMLPRISYTGARDTSDLGGFCYSGAVAQCFQKQVMPALRSQLAEGRTFRRLSCQPLQFRRRPGADICFSSRFSHSGTLVEHWLKIKPLGLRRIEVRQNGAVSASKLPMC